MEDRRIESPKEIPIHYYWTVIKNRKWLLITIIMTTVTAAAIGSFLQTPVYKATATMLLDYTGSNPLDELVGIQNFIFSSEYMNTEKSIVESKNVAERVIARVDLKENSVIVSYYNKPKLSKKIKNFFYSDRKMDIENWLKKFLNKNLEVTPKRDSRILTITFASPDPELSAIIANAFALAYNNYHLELKILPMKESIDWISKKVMELRQDVENKEKGLGDYKAEKGLIIAEGRYNSITIDKLNQLNSNVMSAETRFFEASIKMDLLKKVQSEDGNFDVLPEVISNHLIQKLKIDKMKFENKLSDMSRRVGINHTQYLSVAVELKTVTDKIFSEINNIIISIKNDYEFAEERKNILTDALNKQKQIALQINRDTMGLNMLTREAETTRKIYDTILTKFNETVIKGDINRTNVLVIDKATPPTELDSPKIILNIILSIIVGIFIGIMMIFFIDFLDNTIKEEKDIETILGIPVLGVIPK